MTPRKTTYKTSIAFTHPEIAAQWHPTKNELTPEQVSFGSSVKVWWQCELGHEWTAPTARRTSSRNNCPYCSHHKILVGFNDFASLFPEIAEEWHYEKNENLTPQQCLKSTSKSVWWRCKEAHEWQASIKYRTRPSNRGCPYCLNRRVVAGINDLETLFPNVSEEWNYEKNNEILPSGVMSMSAKKVWWKCSMGHEWKAPISNRTSGQTSCPYCSGKKAIKGLNDFGTLHPDIAKEWHLTKNGNKKPEDFASRSNVKIWWQCYLGHEWESTLDSRVGNKTGCPYCVGKKVLQGFNDFQTFYPEMAAEWHPTKNGKLLPSDFTQKSTKRAWFRCENEHEWETAIGTRTGHKLGCPKCFKTNSKSSPEKKMSDVVEEAFPDAEAFDFRDVVSLRGAFNSVDMCIRVNEVVFFIEYDGKYWHRKEGNFDRDFRKTKLILDAADNYYVIRLRENDLPFLNLEDERLLQHSIKSKTFEADLDAVVNWIKKILVKQEVLNHPKLKATYALEHEMVSVAVDDDEAIDNNESPVGNHSVMFDEDEIDQELMSLRYELFEASDKPSHFDAVPQYEVAYLKRSLEKELEDFDSRYSDWLAYLEKNEPDKLEEWVTQKKNSIVYRLDAIAAGRLEKRVPAESDEPFEIPRARVEEICQKWPDFRNLKNLVIVD